MSLYKRGNIYWVSFTSPGGQRVRVSTATTDRTQAQEHHDRLKSEYWRRDKLKQGPRRRWQEAVVRWVRESQHKRSLKYDVIKLEWLDQYLRNKFLDEIDSQLIETIVTQKELAGVSPATANRYLALMRSILRKAAHEWGWLDKAPHVRMRKEPAGRQRFLTRDEATRLLDELPDHLRPMARFSLATGLRASNVTGLKWFQVDLPNRSAWIPPSDSKSGQAIGVPLNRNAIEVIQGQLGVHPEYVFTYHGHPVRRCSTHAFYKALRRAGIDDCRWHDLRHTWASWHAQAGTTVDVLQRLGGWKSAEMVRRYAHLTMEHLLPHAERICEDTNLSHAQQKAD